MARKQSEYWKKRFEAIEVASNAYGQDVYRQIEPAFTKAQRELQGKIDAWYARIAANNQVSITEAKKLLSAKELAEFKWDVKEFIKYGEDNSLDPVWMKQLENASAKYHISRLEALKIQTQQAMEQAFGNELDDIDAMARRVYTEDYYHAAYEIQRGFNIGWDIAKIDARRLDKLIAKPWAADGKNFSDRIWQSKTSMVNELHNELVRTCVLGKSPDEAIKNMTRFVDKKFKNAKMQAGRLVMTEQAFFASTAQKGCFNDLDVEEFEIVATLDSHTSAICQTMDGKHFPMKDFQPGVTAPPFHVWCRSCTVPYFDDEWSIGERAARGEDGKTYYVPDSMKYPKWKETFVKDSISESTRKDYQKYRNILGKAMPIVEEFAKIQYNEMNRLSFKAYASSIRIGELTPLADFKLYQDMSKQIDSEVVGKTTSNNILITGKSNHFIARIIGSVEQRRNGVTITETLDALLNPVTVDEVRKLKPGRSQRFISERVLVTINPDTGNLIQVNPRTRRKKANQ